MKGCFSINLFNVTLSEIKCWWILALFPVLDNFKYLTYYVEYNDSTHFKLPSASDIKLKNSLFPSLTKFSMMNVIENLREYKQYDIFAIFSSFDCHGKQ